MEEYRAANRDCRKALNDAKNKWIEEQSREIQNNLSRNKTRKAYEVVPTM